MICRKILIALIPPFLMMGCVPAVEKATPIYETTVVSDLEKALAPLDSNDRVLVRDWWKEFNDPQLNAIMDEALAAAPSLQSIEARYAQANTIIESVQSLDLPHISLDASVKRERFSENHIFPPPLGGSTNTQYQPGLTLAYDFDFWNGRRSRILAANNSALAQKASIEAAKIALSSALCGTYLSWNYDEQRLKRLEALEQTTREALNIIMKQHSVGLIDAVAVNDTKSALLLIKQRSEELKRSIEGKKEALSVLGGFLPSYAERLRIPNISETFNLPLPKEVMLNMVARRADVAIAKYTVLSKSYTIEETKAQFYPNISLSGIIGFTSFNWAKLAERSSYTPSAGIALSLPLFDWGMRKAALQHSVSDFNASVYEYNGVVIKAANEIVMLLKQAKRLEAQRRFHESEMEAKKANAMIARQKLKIGLSTKLPYLSARQIVQEGEIETLSLNETARLLQIDLIEALGGGYTDIEDANESR